jgi:hypothetical protein
VPGVRPVTVRGDDAPEAVIPPGEDVTVNDVAAGPLLAGVKDTTSEPKLPPFETESMAAKSGCKNDLISCDPCDPRIGI